MKKNAFALENLQLLQPKREKRFLMKCDVNLSNYISADGGTLLVDDAEPADFSVTAA